MATPEEIQAHAAAVQGNGYAPPTSIAAPVDAPSPVPVDAPVAANDMPPPVTDGSQPPVPVTNVVPGQRVQTAAAFGIGPPAITAQHLTYEGDRTANDALLRSDKVTKEQKDAATEQAKVDTDIAEAQKPVEELHQRELAQQVADQEDAEMEAQENAKKHFDLLQNYNQEIQDHIANQPTDLWGRAGVNKIAGIIGLALGGLGGGATGGKNLVVDTLNSLVDQNLKQNEYKYEMLKGKVSTENQAYAQVRATSHDKQEAADRYKLLSLEQYKQQMTQAAGRFAGPQAKAHADAVIAQIDAQKNELDNKIYMDRLATYRAAANVGIETRGQDLQSIQLQAEEKGRKDKENEQAYVPGWTLPEGKKIPPGETQAIREQQGGAAQVQDTLNEMYNEAKEGGIAAVIANKSGTARLQISLIQQMKLSKRVTEAEANTMKAMTGFLASGSAAELMTAMGSDTVPGALRKAQVQFAKMHVTNLTQGYGYQPDKDNPFVKAMNGDFGDAAPAGVAPSGSADPLAGVKSRGEVAKQAAMDARRKMQVPGYAAY